MSNRWNKYGHNKEMKRVNMESHARRNVCKVCGKTFSGFSGSKICPACNSFVMRMKKGSAK